jgi:hypothetical protein
VVAVVADVEDDVDVVVIVVFVVCGSVDVDVVVVVVVCGGVDVDVASDIVVGGDDGLAVIVSGFFGVIMMNSTTRESVTAEIVKTIKDVHMILTQR